MTVMLTPLQVKKLADLLHDLAKGWLVGAVAVPLVSTASLTSSVVALVAGLFSIYLSLQLYKMWEQNHD